MYDLCMSFALGFGLRYVHYVLMQSFADYEFSSRWRLLIMVTLTNSTMDEDELMMKVKNSAQSRVGC